MLCESEASDWNLVATALVGQEDLYAASTADPNLGEKGHSDHFSWDGPLQFGSQDPGPASSVGKSVQPQPVLLKRMFKAGFQGMTSLANKITPWNLSTLFNKSNSKLHYVQLGAVLASCILTLADPQGALPFLLWSVTSMVLSSHHISALRGPTITYCRRMAAVSRIRFRSMCSHISYRAQRLWASPKLRVPRSVVQWLRQRPAVTVGAIILVIGLDVDKLFIIPLGFIWEWTGGILLPLLASLFWGMSCRAAERLYLADLWSMLTVHYGGVFALLCSLGLKKIGQRMHTEVRTPLKARPTLSHSTPGMCIICQDATATHAMIPCGHRIGCGTCVSTLDRCPICMTTCTHNAIKIFDCTQER